MNFSHFHLDHCGALPYFSEMVGYDGPIYMTHPTKAISPILLVGTVVCTYIIYMSMKLSENDQWESLKEVLKYSLKQHIQMYITHKLGSWNLVVCTHRHLPVQCRMKNCLDLRPFTIPTGHLFPWEMINETNLMQHHGIRPFLVTQTGQTNNIKWIACVAWCS